MESEMNYFGIRKKKKKKNLLQEIHATLLVR